MKPEDEHVLMRGEAREPELLAVIDFEMYGHGLSFG
jgi:hypothetical protein